MFFLIRPLAVVLAAMLAHAEDGPCIRAGLLHCTPSRLRVSVGEEITLSVSDGPAQAFALRERASDDETFFVTPFIPAGSSTTWWVLRGVAMAQ